MAVITEKIKLMGGPKDGQEPTITFPQGTKLPDLRIAQDFDQKTKTWIKHVYQRVGETNSYQYQPPVVLKKEPEKSSEESSKEGSEESPEETPKEE